MQSEVAPSKVAQTCSSGLRFFRVGMGLRSTHSDESHECRRPRESGDSGRLDSRFRGNDVTLDRAATTGRYLWACDY